MVEADVARKVLTRAESQAQTRQDLSDSAEQMFYANGYHATSIAAIAAEAGRTIGAVYSNFESKEALCLEVLKNRFMSEMTRLLGDMMTAGESLDARLEALSSWWLKLSTETPLILLTAEYLISTFYDDDQAAANREVIERVKESARVLLEDTVPEPISKTDPRINDAIDAVFSTSIGLALARPMGVIDAERGAELMVTTLRMWFEKLSHPPEELAPS
jgi:AcrR family transcriptional regulator